MIRQGLRQRLASVGGAVVNVEPPCGYQDGCNLLKGSPVSAKMIARRSVESHPHRTAIVVGRG